jgi:spore germination protein KC
MNKYKKIIVIICLIMNCLIMSSCFSYKDINRVLFITALIIDAEDNGNPILYAEAYRGVRGSAPEGMDERILFKGKGKTMFEAVRDMNATSSYRLNYTQNKALIFTENAAEFGLDNYIDFLARDQELLIRPYISVFLGDPDKLIKLNIIQEKYLGFYITELIDSIGDTSRAVKLTLNEYLNQRTMDKESSVITIIDIPKDSLEVKLGVNGGAVIRDDKMVGKLDESEGQGYNFVNDNVSTGTLEITNPCDINKFITLEIKKSKTKSEVSYYDNIVHLKKTIKVKVDFGEAQKRIKLTNENIMKIQDQSEENIKIACITLFEKYKGFEIDIFSIYQEVYKKYPKIKIKDIINKTELQVDVDVEIMNTGDTYNFH